MTDAHKLAQRYFDLSNQSALDEIAKLFTPNSTYDSANTGSYHGRDDIMAMQRKFHGSFNELNWQAQNVEEVQPGLIHFEFTFTGIKLDGTQITASGVEDITVVDKHIQHISIRAKD